MSSRGLAQEHIRHTYAYWDEGIACRCVVGELARFSLPGVPGQLFIVR